MNTISPLATFIAQQTHTVCIAHLVAMSAHSLMVTFVAYHTHHSNALVLRIRAGTQLALACPSVNNGWAMSAEKCVEGFALDTLLGCNACVEQSRV